VETSETASQRVADALAGVESVLATLDGERTELRTGAEAMRDTLRALRERAFTGPECQGICGGEPLAEAVRTPAGRLRGGEGPVSALEEMMLRQASQALDRLLADVNRVLTGPLAAFAAELRASDYTPLPDTAPVRRSGG
jgi:hypothetical protein